MVMFQKLFSGMARRLARRARNRTIPGSAMADLAAEHEGKQITFADTQARPVPVITSPEWSGSETGGRSCRVTGS